MSLKLPSIVVGSGPAGVACAQALLKAGQPVLMLDAGTSLENSRREIVDRLGGLLPLDWQSEDVVRLKDHMEPTSSGVPLKYCFGSDFPYRSPESSTTLDREGVALQPSFAKGGLSNVWGAAALPYRSADMVDWPFSADDLRDHYEGILQMTGLSGTRDGLLADFPLFSATPLPLKPSSQMAALFADMQRHEPSLKRRGISIGQSRLMVKGRSEAGGAGCEYCGMCMYGCAYGHIFNSASIVDSWQGNPLFRYLPGVLVERVEEEEASARAIVRHIGKDQQGKIEGRRIFLAAGVIPTTQILLESLQMYDRPVTIRDSQYFLLPLLRLKRARTARTEPTNTLSQLFVEILDAKVSPYTVHLQLYGWNDMIDAGLRRELGIFGIEPIIDQISSRMIVAQGYLHSDHSSLIEMQVSRGIGSSAPKVRLSAKPREETLKRVRSVVWKLHRSAAAFSAIPLMPKLYVSAPGRGFHCGGTFPMRSRAGETESDLLGRPSGFSRIHAVDATVFPSIAATTITLTAMANAHRIGTEAAKL